MKSVSFVRVRYSSLLGKARIVRISSLEALVNIRTCRGLDSDEDIHSG